MDSTASPAAPEVREVLDLEGAADYLGVKSRTLGELVRTGQVPAAKVGRQWRFLRSQLTEWLARGGGEADGSRAT